MASASFRDSIGSLGWSRRQDEPVSTAPETGVMASIRNLNPFQDRSYVRLPTSETGPGAPLPAPTRREEEEGWFIRESKRLSLFFVISPYNSASLFLALACFAHALSCCETVGGGGESRRRIPVVGHARILSGA